MTTEPPKTSPAIPDHSFPQIAPYPPPQHASGGTYPPPGSYPQFYPYPPHPAEGNNPNEANNANATLPGPQFVVPYPPPPGMVYTFSHPPPGQGYPPYPSPVSPTVRPKRKQVKMACTNCAAACKRCDEHRPCDRCTKYGLTDSCVDGQRKERKKGIKRGPYKRRKKSNSTESFGTYSQQQGEGEWHNQNNQPQPHNSTVNTTAAIHAVAQFAAPEGYPYYYPPPGYMPPMSDGQPAHEGSPTVNGQPQPMVPYYIHPGSYPPFSYYPHPGPGAFGHPGVPPPPAHILDHPSEKKGAQGGADRSETGPGVEATGPIKKRTRTAKNGEVKTKKGKAAASRLQKGNKANDVGEGEVEHEEAEG